MSPKQQQNQQKKKFPIPNVVYSIATKGADWFNYQFATGKNKERLEKIREKMA